ncbi:hypothetical protein ACIPL1_12215 [Pseudomonas sp. NPDC090202]|uniref:hypothetical protein n=1 Tax=unclassified Pseudomonas TaxID=196821 RepID=UPI0037F540F8
MATTWRTSRSSVAAWFVGVGVLEGDYAGKPGDMKTFKRSMSRFFLQEKKSHRTFCSHPFHKKLMATCLKFATSEEYFFS